MAEFPSEQWLAEYKDAINASEAYQEAAETWEGDLAYEVHAEPDKNVPNDVWIWMDLWHGECRDAKQITPEEGAKSKFAISAPYSRWKELIKGELDPTKAMLQGKLKLRGDLPTIVRYVTAANELVAIAGRIGTTFPDD